MMTYQQCKVEANAALDAGGEMTPSEREAWWTTPNEHLAGQEPWEAMFEDDTRSAIVTAAKAHKSKKRTTDWNAGLPPSPYR